MARIKKASAQQRGRQLRLRPERLLPKARKKREPPAPFFQEGHLVVLKERDLLFAPLAPQPQPSPLFRIKGCGILCESVGAFFAP